MSEMNTIETVEETTEIIETEEKVGFVSKAVNYCKKNWKVILAAFGAGAAVGGAIGSAIASHSNCDADIIDLNEDEFVESDVADVAND